MFKNVASQKITVYAFDSTTNLPKTGDAANLTAYVSKDDGTLTVLGDTSATEVDATNGKGYYIFDLAQAETNGDKLLFTCKSSTSNIVVLGMPAIVYTVPPSFTAFVTPTGATVGSVTGAVGSVTGAVGSVTGAVGSVTGAVGSVTGNVGGSVASVTAAVSITGDLSATMKSSVATAALTTAMAESYSTDGSTATLAQALYLIMQRLTEFAIASTTITIKKLDGSTTAATLTLDDATSPTSSTRAS